MATAQRVITCVIIKELDLVIYWKLVMCMYFNKTKISIVPVEAFWFSNLHLLAMKPFEPLRIECNRYKRFDDAEQTEKCLENHSGLDMPLALASNPQSQVIWKLLTAICLSLAACLFAQTIQLRQREQVYRDEFPLAPR